MSRRTITLRQPDHPWVGRGGLKLAHALERFSVDVTGTRALDIGASTGGFTDVLLQRGARAWSRSTSATTSSTGGCAPIRASSCHRGRERAALALRICPPSSRPFDLVTIDVSFISLAHILPVVPALLAPGGRVDRARQAAVRSRTDEVGAGGIVARSGDPRARDRTR